MKEAHRGACRRVRRRGGGSCDFLVRGGFCGAVGPAGEAEKTSNVGIRDSSNLKKVARGRPADGTHRPFYFQVDTRGRGF
jgi:hypothetical protein